MWLLVHRPICVVFANGCVGVTNRPGKIVSALVQFLLTAAPSPQASSERHCKDAVMATDKQRTLAVLEAISLPQSLKMMTLRQTDSYCPGALALEYICLLQYAHTHKYPSYTSIFFYAAA